MKIILIKYHIFLLIGVLFFSAEAFSKPPELKVGDFVVVHRDLVIDNTFGFITKILNSNEFEVEGKKISVNGPGDLYVSIDGRGGIVPHLSKGSKDPSKDYRGRGDDYVGLYNGILPTFEPLTEMYLLHILQPYPYDIPNPLHYLVANARGELYQLSTLPDESWRTPLNVDKLITSSPDSCVENYCVGDVIMATTVDFLAVNRELYSRFVNFLRIDKFFSRKVTLKPKMESGVRLTVSNEQGVKEILDPSERVLVKSNISSMKRKNDGSLFKVGGEYYVDLRVYPWEKQICTLEFFAGLRYFDPERPERFVPVVNCNGRLLHSTLEELSFE